MKNKGFTLIELLAVIVILAIIALIATPMILGVIDTAKKGSAESSALGYVEAVEKSSLIAVIEKGSQYPDGNYTVTNDKITLSGVEYDVDYKGDNVTGTLTIANGQVSSAELTFSKIYANAVDYANGEATASS